MLEYFGSSTAFYFFRSPIRTLSPRAAIVDQKFDAAESGSLCQAAARLSRLQLLAAGKHYRARQACPSDLSEGPACQVRVRKDLFVRSAAQRWMLRFASSGTTSVPLRPFGGTCLSGPRSEGPACQVRRPTFDHPLPFIGYNKRAPPCSTDAVEGVSPISAGFPRCDRGGGIRILRSTRTSISAGRRGSTRTTALAGAIHEWPVQHLCARGMSQILQK
ncbi:MAG: hypothetical protein KatS3mg112_0892 [Thermogutta sp.]|nr:MAG: hypothetical protein KatS3mg112_0892 [Thermogutta sp.]